MTTNSPAPSTSPIPFRRLLRVEWRKSLDTRAARWVLTTGAVLTLAAVVIPLARPDDLAQSMLGYATFAALGLVLLLPVVSVLAFTAEWSQRTAIATFTQEPRRARVLTAKIVSGLLLATAGAAFCATVAAAGAFTSELLGRDVSWQLEWRPVLGFVLFVLLNGLLGMAYGALLHNTAAAIVLLFVPATVWGLIGAFDGISGVREWIDPNLAFGWVLSGAWDGRLSRILTATAVWMLLPMVLGLLRTRRREVA